MTPGRLAAFVSQIWNGTFSGCTLRSSPCQPPLSPDASCSYYLCSGGTTQCPPGGVRLCPGFTSETPSSPSPLALARNIQETLHPPTCSHPSLLRPGPWPGRHKVLAAQLQPSDLPHGESECRTSRSARFPTANRFCVSLLRCLHRPQSDLPVQLMCGEERLGSGEFQCYFSQPDAMMASLGMRCRTGERAGAAATRPAAAWG